MASIEINTNVGCKLACTFCPQDKLVKKYNKTKSIKDLSFDSYKELLSRIPKHVRIDFSGMTEPFLNLEASKMVNHTFDQGYAVAIYTTLTGLNIDDAKNLLNKWSKRILKKTPWVVHLPDKQNNMRGWKKTKEYTETLEYFLTFKKANEIEFLQFMTMNKDGDVQEEIKNLINSKIPNFFAGSRAENLNREKADDSIIEKPIQHINPVVCKSTPFYDHNNLFPNGDVVLCCMDYSLDYVIGNLFQEDYYQIFSGEKINEIRKRAMKFGYDKDFICKNCSNACEIVNEDKEHEGWKLSDNVSWQSDLESKKNKFLYNENQKLKEEISTIKKI
tara:strand:+ start:3656 stop:4651 length:996 start_codon:yes stop_codon:yes gene_type:complete